MAMYTIYATRNVEKMDKDGMVWTRVDPPPTFYVRACSDSNAEAIAADVLGVVAGQVKIHIVATKEEEL